jgi:hypothetical protein
MAREGLASQDSGVEKTAGEGALFKMGDPFRMRRQEAAASTSLDAWIFVRARSNFEDNIRQALSTEYQ